MACPLNEPKVKGIKTHTESYPPRTGGQHQGFATRFIPGISNSCFARDQYIAQVSKSQTFFRVLFYHDNGFAIPCAEDHQGFQTPYR